jgi:dihydrolipoamide dehydrogenase
MHRQKDNAVSSLVRGIAGLFKKNGVTHIQGHGSFRDRKKLIVTKNDGSSLEVEANNIVVATGSQPVAFPDVGFDESEIVSSTGALSIRKVPNHLIVIGGGIIGLELGSVWNRLGAKVTVIEYLDRIGADMDPSVSSAFQKILQKQGMVFMLKTKVDRVRKELGKVEVDCLDIDGNKSSTLVLLVLNC